MVSADEDGVEESREEQDNPIHLNTSFLSAIMCQAQGPRANRIGPSAAGWRFKDPQHYGWIVRGRRGKARGGQSGPFPGYLLGPRKETVLRFLRLQSLDTAWT